QLYSPFHFTPSSPPTTYTLSLHDALPIYFLRMAQPDLSARLKELVDSRVALETKLQNETSELSDSRSQQYDDQYAALQKKLASRSEEHTSELQSPDHLVCRLLLEKKKTT